MAKPTKPQADKKSQKPQKAKQDTDAKRGAGQAQSKKGKGKGKDVLRDQVLALGGDKDDLDLLNGVEGDGQLVQGEQAADPSLAGDVSKFLQGLKSGKEPKGKPEAKNIEAKTKSSKKPQEKEREKEKKPKSKPSKDVKDKAKAVTPEPALDPAEQKPKVTAVKTTGKLVFPPNAHWYTALPPLTPPQKPLSTPSTSQISELSEKASTLLTADAAAYQASSAFTGNSASDSHFLNTILSKGTLSDRLSALTLLVQASPVHNIKALESLKSMAERGRGKGGRDEGLKAMRCVVDWWVGGGAPGRKLKYFRDQPLLHPSVNDEYLIMWYFEDWLKKYFFSILQILETYSLDPLPYVRTQALSFIATLLREKPEQEQNLLRLLVNKLGDTERSVCSRASYHLLQVLQAHPAMKGVIVREVRALIFRPAASTSAAASQALESTKNSHIRFGDDEQEKPKPKGKGKDVGKGHTMDRWNSHAWYYSAVTLNQVVLTSSDHDRDVARVLIDAYFEMFREILGGIKGQEAAGEAEKADAEEGKKSKKGKAKEVRGDAGFAEVEDSNSRLISAVLTGVNRALPFAKVDMSSGNDVFVKHMDTLFLITHTSTFNISLQALLLILQVTTSLPASTPSTSKEGASVFSTSLKDRFYRTLYSSLLDQRLATSNKQAMYLNLLFKALKADTNVERVKAFVRRFIQILAVGVSGTGGVEFIAGGLYLLGELFSTVPGLRQMFNVPASEKAEETYDPKKRDPQYAHASSTPLYELLPLLHHYHPAVSLHAHQLLTARPITATADLSLNTISHFLDRFVYKNPKKPKPKGASAMQPAASGVDGASGVKLMKGEVAHGEAPVNEEKWWKRRVEDIPVDEVFFHKYFTQKSKKEKEMAEKVKKRKKGDESDDDELSDFEGEASEEEAASDVEEQEKGKEEDEDEENSDKEEAEIWKAMKATLPTELQDDDLDEDSDDLPSDLDDDSEGAAVDEDEGEASAAEDDEDQEEDEQDDDAFSMVEDSDAEDLLPLDADIPGGLIEYDGTDSEAGGEDEEWGGIGASKTNKRKRDGEEDGKKKRKKIRSLPTFASYEDYAKMIEDGPEDNI